MTSNTVSHPPKRFIRSHEAATLIGRHKRPPVQIPDMSDWIRAHSATGFKFHGLDPSLSLLIGIMTETGLRGSEALYDEVCRFHLDADVPYVSVQATPDSDLKSRSASRDIPMVGISLAAARAYRAIPKPFVNDINRAMFHLRRSPDREHLYPSGKSIFVCLRHDLNSRLRVSGASEAVRGSLLGHWAHETPPLSKKRDALMKIAHAVPEGVFQ